MLMAAARERLWEEMTRGAVLLTMKRRWVGPSRIERGERGVVPCCVDDDEGEELGVCVDEEEDEVLMKRV